MSFQIGWVGKERPVNAVLPALMAAEETNNPAEFKTAVRNEMGFSFVTIAFLARHTGYPFLFYTSNLLGPGDTLANLFVAQGLDRRRSSLALFSMTAANQTHLERHKGAPSITKTVYGKGVLLTSMTGAATRFAHDALGVQHVTADTKDITHALIAPDITGVKPVRRGQKILARRYLLWNINHFALSPHSMHMVFFLIDSATEMCRVNLMRSMNDPSWIPDPFLWYSSESGVVSLAPGAEGGGMYSHMNVTTDFMYGSTPEAVKTMTGQNPIPLEEGTHVAFHPVGVRLGIEGEHYLDIGG